MAGQIWFGNKTKAGYLPAPATGMTKNSQGYSEEIQFENGGAWVERSKAKHIVFEADFPVQDSSKYDGLNNYQRYADGEYGDGYLYWVDPMAEDQNLFSPNWAAPGLTEQGWKRIHDTTPTFSAVGANTYDKPVRKATYPLTLAANAMPIGANSVFTMLIPNDCNLYIGGSGSFTGTGVLRARAFGVGSGFVNSVINPSPQDATQLATGFFGVGAGNTTALVAGAGVGGGKGFRVTQTLDSAASGNVGVQAGANATLAIPVTPGEPFTPSLYVGADLTRSAQILWVYWDASSTQVGATRYGSTTVALVANAPLVRIQEATETVPPGAVRAIIRAYDPATAWTGTRTNLATNPNSETVALNIEGASTGITNALSTTRYHSGTQSTKLTRTVNGAGGVSLSSATGALLVPSAAGVTWTVSAWVYVESGALPSWLPYNSSYAAIAPTTWTQPTATGVWQRVRVTFTTPDATGWRLYENGNPISTYYVDDVLIEQSAVLGSSFDGNTSDVNLLTNSSFETDLTGYSVETTVAMERTTAAAYVGAACALVTWSTTSANSFVRSFTTVTGRVYTYSYWVKAAVGTPALALSISGTIISTVGVTTNATWQRVSATFVAGSTTTTAYLYRTGSPIAGNAAYVDAGQLEVGELSDWSDTGVVVRAYAWTGPVNASTSTRSGDSMTVDRVSTAAGPYFDGSAEFPGAVWEGAAYASRSIQTSTNTDITLSADSAMPAFSVTLSGSLYKYVQVYLTRTTSAASTASVTALWAQIVPVGQTPVLSRHVPGKGTTGLRFSSAAIPETYVMANRHLTGMNFQLTEIEAWS